MPTFLNLWKSAGARRHGGAIAEILILTAARSGEVNGACWSEIDLLAALGTIPAERTKAGREQRVPLSTAAMAVLEKRADGRTGDIVFPGAKTSSKLSSMAMEMLLRRMKVTGASVHGIRSSFRDWASNQTGFAREVAEAALAHVIGDKAEQAYRRGDALDKRRALLDAWAKYCNDSGAEKVISIDIARQRQLA